MYSTFPSLKIFLKLFVLRLEKIEALGDAGIQVCVPHVTFPLQH